MNVCEEGPPTGGPFFSPLTRGCTPHVVERNCAPLAPPYGQGSRRSVPFSSPHAAGRAGAPFI